MEDACSQRCFYVCVLENLDKVGRRSCTATANNWDMNSASDKTDEVKIEALASAIPVDAVQQQLAGTQLLCARRKLDDGYVSRLSTSGYRALIPPSFSGLFIVAEDELVLVRTIVARVHIHPLRIDAHDDRLAPVRICDRLDRTRPVPLPAVRAQSLNGVDRLGADGHLVGARAEVGAGDLERGARRAVRVDAVFDAPADCERDEDGLGGRAHDGEHGLVPEGRLPEGGDVEEADLVGPCGVVPCCERDGLTEVAYGAG